MRHASEYAQTKLFRPRVRAAVPRPRLFALLERAAERHLGLVSAPAGYGKTTLAASWLEETERSSSWVALDAGDTSVPTLLRCLSDALTPHTRDFELDTEQPGALQLLSQMVAVPSDHVVVLDDYQEIRSREIHELFDYLLQRLPPHIHFIILTRHDPPIGLSRLRGKDEVTEIRAADLEFTVEETARLLAESEAGGLEGVHVEALRRRADGWAAGIKMMAASLRGKQDPTSFVESITAGSRAVFDYLLEEVMAGVDPGLAEFLMRCSILDRLTAELCSVVAGVENSQALLELMERENLFVTPLDENRRWYKLHHLFAEVLLVRLEQTRADELLRLHAAAADWLAEHDGIVEAVRHYIAAKEYHRAASLLEVHGEKLMMESSLEPVLHWAGAIPDAVLSDHPAVAIIQAWASLLSGRPMELVNRRLKASRVGRESPLASVLRSFQLLMAGQVEDGIAVAEEVERVASGSFVSGFLDWVKALAKLLEGDLQGGEVALRELSRQTFSSGNTFVGLMALVHRAEVHVIRCELAAAEQLCRKALSLGVDSRGEPLPVSGAAMLGLGEVLRLRGRIDEAECMLREGIETLRGWFAPAGIDGHVSLAKVLRARGEIDESDRQIERAADLAESFDITRLDDRMVEADRCTLLLQSGRVAEASWRITELVAESWDDAESFVDQYLRGKEAILEARLALASGAAADAHETALAIAEDEHAQGRNLRAIEAFIVAALAAAEEGDIEGRTRSIERAIALAEPAGCTQPFIDEGSLLASLLYAARSDGCDQPFIAGLLAAFPLEDQTDVAGAAAEEAGIDRLSRRELEVLAHIARGDSNKEIAQELYVSVRTVKWHTSNIYDKLDVTGRTAAIARARQLGILND